jgi:predicted RNase H-like nuclease (RuvC/YqgF family)
MTFEILTEICKFTHKSYKYITASNNESEETATGQMNDTVRRQQAQEDQRPAPHKHRRSERQEGQTVVTAEAIGVRDEDKRGSEDRGKGNREHQFQTQPVNRQKHKSDAQEQHDRRIKEMERNVDAQRWQITGLTQERKLLQEDVKRTEGSLTRSERDQRKLQSEIEDLRDRLAQSQRHVHVLQQQLQRHEQENKLADRVAPTERSICSHGGVAGDAYIGTERSAGVPDQSGLAFWC